MKLRPSYGTYGRVGPAKGFTWGEVRCTDGTLPSGLAFRRRVVAQARNLNRLRLAIARRFRIDPWTNVSIAPNSWYRSPAYNASIGGASRSEHKTGRATDVQIVVRTRAGKRVRLAPKFVALLAARHVPEVNRGGIGTYTTFTHLDNRPNGPARWRG